MFPCSLHFKMVVEERDVRSEGGGDSLRGCKVQSDYDHRKGLLSTLFVCDA